MNTNGDNGNLLMLQYAARQKGVQVETDILSLKQPFNADEYDLVFFGSGQDYEQSIVARDIQYKSDALKSYIEKNGVLLAISGGFQLLGHYYMDNDGKRIEGIGALDHYTLAQNNNRFVGNASVLDETSGETYVGFENHGGRTFLGDNLKPLGKIVEGKGNNNEDGTEGAHYKNVFCSYFHGPLLVHNPHLADRLIDLAIERKQKKNLLA